MAGFHVGHVGLHVPSIEEELAFLEKLGGTLTETDKMDNGRRVAFVSMDGKRHHTIALFEDREQLSSGNSRMQGTGLHHIAMPVDSRDDVNKWQKELESKGVQTAGPSIQGPKGGGLENGSGSYSIFFQDPNGICFEIYTGSMSVAEFKTSRAATK
jgi:catechol-2,3-dioxygenase